VRPRASTILLLKATFWVRFAEVNQRLGANRNFTPVRSRCRQTTVQCQTAFSKSRSNFGGKAVALGSDMQAPVDEKFRTVQSIMEALFPKMI
jgi:hypothetical protein